MAHPSSVLQHYPQAAVGPDAVLQQHAVLLNVAVPAVT